MRRSSSGREDHRLCPALASGFVPRNAISSEMPFPSDSERPLTAVTNPDALIRAMDRPTTTTMRTAPAVTSTTTVPPPQSTTISGTWSSVTDTGLAAPESETTSSIHSSVTTSSGGGVLHTLQDPSRYEEHGEIGNGTSRLVFS